MLKKILEKIQDFLIVKKMKSKGYDCFMPKQQLNPLCEIKAEYQGKEIFKQPFMLVMCTYLKDYGFDPDSKSDGSLIVTFNWGGGMDMNFPLWVKKGEGSDFGKVITMDEAIKLGYFVPPRRAEAK
jgi:hypothetical protein